MALSHSFCIVICLFTIHTFIQSFIHNIRWGPYPYLHSCRLGGWNLHGVLSGDSNSGVPYSKPAHYHLSSAAPYWAVLHPSWATRHPNWATLHSNWATVHLNWATLHPSELRCTLTASQRTTIWAPLHPTELCCSLAELRCTLTELHFTLTELRCTLPAPFQNIIRSPHWKEYLLSSPFWVIIFFSHWEN